jgi:hypothetical protein
MAGMSRGVGLLVRGQADLQNGVNEVSSTPFNVTACCYEYCYGVGKMVFFGHCWPGMACLVIGSGGFLCATVMKKKVFIHEKSYNSGIQESNLKICARIYVLEKTTGS